MGLKRPAVAVTVVVGAAVLLAIISLAIWFGQTDQGFEIEIFQPPKAVCEEYNTKPFAQMVIDVEATEDQDLEVAVSRMQAGYLRKTAKLDPAPDGVRLQLILLADQVEAAVLSQDYGEAAATAAALDAELTVFCTD